MKQKKQKMTVYQMAVCALMAAILCLLGPISIPLGPVPLSLTMMAVFLAVFVLGTKYGCISYGIYYLLGVAGLPVFSGGAGGIGKALGPTGGYLIGMLFMALITGGFLKKFPTRWYLLLLGMLLGNGVNLLFGTAWFAFSAHCSWQYALEICVLPFLVTDLIKILLSLSIGLSVRRRLRQAGLLF